MRKRTQINEWTWNICANYARDYVVFGEIYAAGKNFTLPLVVKVIKISHICFTPSSPFFTQQVEFSLALMVTVLFWSLLYDYKEAPSYSNLFVHLLQSVVVLIDQWVVVSYIQILWLVFCFSFATQNTQKHTGLCRGDNGDLSQLGPLSQFPWSGAKFVFERDL